MTNARDNFSEEALDDGPVLTPLLLTLWSYRRGMLVAFGAVVVMFISAALLMYAVLPKETVASIKFQLTFQGADQDKFPNGAPFSSAEIVATPVLSEVFKKDELERYVPFARFKEAMFVLQANPDLELLSYEYQAKLADPRLSPVDRSRIEEEFQKKRESMKSGFLSLNFRKGDRVRTIPPAMLNKILQDTLSTWAEQAAERKGAIRYNIGVFSKNALRKEFLSAQDYVVAADVLRVTIERVLSSVEEMSKIPGAEAVRLGDDQITLADLRVGLQNLIRFKVDPLMALIRTTGISRNIARTDVYFEDRLLEMQLAREEVRQRVTSLQDALRAYQQTGSSAPASAAREGGTAGVTPQLSESFIDRVVQLSTQANDVKYRQDLTDRIILDGIQLADMNRQVDYYESMRKAFAAARTGGANPNIAAEVTRRTNDAYSDISELIEKVQAFYKLVSQQNLNPDTMLYTITSPFVVRTASSLTPYTVFTYFLLVLFAAVIFIPVACLTHSYFRHWIAPAAPPSAGVHQPAGSDHVVGV